MTDTPNPELKAIANAFAKFMRQCKAGEYQDGLGHRILRNPTLKELGDAIARATGQPLKWDRRKAATQARRRTKRPA